MGNKWVRVFLSLVVSLAIFAGVAAFVADLHPMRPYYSMANEGCAADTGIGSESRLDCYDRYNAIMDRSDGNDRLVAIAAGAAAVALFWLLVNYFYLRPRRRRQETI